MLNHIVSGTQLSSRKTIAVKNIAFKLAIKNILKQQQHQNKTKEKQNIKTNDVKLIQIRYVRLQGVKGE